MNNLKELEVAALYQRCDVEQFDFETTADLEELTDIIGQPRAVEAVQFGIGIDQSGYNIFALGPVGSGKQSLVQQFFEQAASTEPVPSDWCYVNNFEQTHKPKALRLPPGKGGELRQDVEQLVEELRTALSTAFESEEYQTRQQEIQEEFKERQESTLSEVQQKAQAQDLAMLRTPSGIVFAPIRQGEVMSAKEVQELSEEERQRIQADVEELQEELQKLLRQLPRLQREMREQMKELNREMATFAVSGLIDELREKYADFPEVVDYFNALQQDVIDNVKLFLQQEEGGQGPNDGPMRSLMAAAQPDSSPLRRYQVNVLVDHNQSEGAPVIYEDNPTYSNLLGRIEHIARMGALTTDFNLLKSGALHRANGGYLILDARKLLLQPFAWEGLKRALQAGQLRIESPGQSYGLISTVSLEPEPIPLKVKVALVGAPLLYYLLCAYDPDFGELFKVAADFAEEMDRNADNQRLYARIIGNLVRQNDLRPFHREAVARVIERSARMVGDAEKLSTHMQGVANLLREANYWAKQNGNGVVQAADVQRAIDSQIFRSDRLRERMQEAILRDTIFIDAEGAKIGQVNGLSVIQLGGTFTFGRPSRITARVQLGQGKVIDIEREVELSGPIHSKGVLILAGYLGERYGTDKPLSLSASLVFEQSYSGVEGDSASSTELYALLSAIAQVPIKQSVAVTGSVNQHGQVQAIGGVNEKIEGFFDICQAKGLNGEQGVLIPAANVKHLMLRQEVISAVDEGRFHIYPVETIDQGIEILTGIPAGQRDEEGNYPEDSLNYLVEQRLAEFAERRLAFSKATKEDQE